MILEFHLPKPFSVVCFFAIESFSVMDDLTLSLAKSISFNFTLGSFCAWFFN